MAKEILTDAQAKERDKQKEEASEGLTVLELVRINATGTGPVVDIAERDSLKVDVEVKRVWANADDAKAKFQLQVRDPAVAEDWEDVGPPQEFTHAGKATLTASNTKEATEARLYYEVTGTQPTFEVGAKGSTSKSKSE